MADHSDSDEELEVPEEEVTKLKGSVLFRGKKWLATKTATSKMGRGLVAQYIGSEGNSMLHALKSAAKKDVGEKRAKQLKQNILVLALKAKLLFDEKHLLPKDVMGMAEPINEMTKKLHENLQAPKMDPLQTELLVAKFAMVQEFIITVLTPHVKDKNLSKLVDTTNYFGSKDFLEKLVGDEKYAEERDAIKNAINELVQPLLDSAALAALDMCHVTACYENSMPPQGTFPGSKYCPAHQAENWAKMQEGAPAVGHFLVNADAKEYPPFVENCLPHLDVNEVQLYCAITNFKKCRDTIRRMFAEALFEKYLDPKRATTKIDVPAELIASIQEEIEKCAPPPPKLGQNVPDRLPPLEIFDAVQELAHAKLQTLFEQHFLVNQQWQKFVDVTARG